MTECMLLHENIHANQDRMFCNPNDPNPHPAVAWNTEIGQLESEAYAASIECLRKSLARHELSGRCIIDIRTEIGRQERLREQYESGEWKRNRGLGGRL